MSAQARPDAGLRALVGDGSMVPCVDGHDRPYLNLDAAASTSALPAVARAVDDFLPSYASVHRGAGHKSQLSTRAYEAARTAALGFAGRSPDTGDIAIICRNTTEAINHLAYRLRLAADDVVVTTVVEHHANLLPWARLCRRRFVECGPDGSFAVEDVTTALDAGPQPRLLAVTGASNVTGWQPPLDDIVAASHARSVPVLVDAAQLAPHRPLPADADFLAWSGHKMYAPFGAGVLVGPRQVFADGDPFLAGGGAVDQGDLPPVAWTPPPPRAAPRSPHRLGAGALQAADGTPSATTTPPCTKGFTPASRPYGASTSSAPEPAAEPRSRWSRSPSPACPTPWSPRGSAPSTRSAFATAASAPTPTSCACSASVPTRSPGTGTPSAGATTATCPEPSAPVPDCRPRSTTSTASSTPSPTSPRGGPPRSSTSRTPALAISGSGKDRPCRPATTVPSAPRAPEADRSFMCRSFDLVQIASRSSGQLMQRGPPRPRPSSLPVIVMTSMPALRSLVLVSTLRS